MTSATPSRQPFLSLSPITPWNRLYHSAVGATGLALVIALFPNPSARFAVELLILALGGAWFSAVPIALPDGQLLSLAGPFVLAATMIHGAELGVLLASVAGLCAWLQAWRQPLLRVWFQLGVQTLPAGALALGFQLAGGRSGEVDPRSSLAALVGAGLHTLAHLALERVGRRVQTRTRPQPKLPIPWGDGGLFFAVTSCAGLFLAHVYRTGGWSEVLSALLLLAALHYSVRLYLSLKRTHLEALTRISGYVSRRSHPTLHVRLAGALAWEVARRLHLRPADAHAAQVAALLHDIGEVKLQDGLLQKVHRRIMLTDSQVQAYRQHSTLGEDLVASIPGLERAAAAIRHHHEHWDGSGYPDGLKGEEIPLPARIIAAVEAYLEATTYAPNVDQEGREQIALDLAGRAADPRVARALAAVVREQPRLPVPAGTDPTRGDTEDLLLGLLPESVRQSSLLNQLGFGHYYTYTRGQFATSSDSPATPPQPHAVARLAARCLVDGRLLREYLVQQQPAQILDVYCFPISGQTAGIISFDVTRVLVAERQERQRLYVAYGDVLAAVTRGRMRLLLPGDLPGLLAAGESLGAVELDTMERNREARLFVGDCLAKLGCSGSILFRTQVAVAEAVGNVFKHAGHGRLELRSLPRMLRAIISDQGPGIPLNLLPQVCLVDGFSTKTSLGKGYTLMLHYIDRIQIATGGEGTTLVLEKALPSGEGSDA